MSNQLLFLLLLTVVHVLNVIAIIVNNQLDAQFFFMYVYFYSLHVSRSHVPIIRRINLFQYGIWYMSFCIDDCLVCRL